MKGILDVNARRHFATFFFALVLLGLAAVTAVAQAERHLLLVDDHHVLYRAGTKRVFHPASPDENNPIVREDQAWEMAIGWTSIYRDPATGKYQLWYQAYAGGRDERKSHKCVVCYAESDDGVHFTKPMLGLHDFKTDRKPWDRRFPETRTL